MSGASALRVLVVGGAGYIGSHTVRALKQAGHYPVVFDDFRAGHRQAVDRLQVALVEGDMCEPGVLSDLLMRRKFDAVVHFAALAYVGESVQHPSKYYINNVSGTLNLLEAMRVAGVEHIVFSSTCATYGNPQTPALDETHPQQPINPYGRGKLMAEWMLRDFDAAYGIRHVALRYFNAAGASRDGLLGEEHYPETHLVPLCLLAAAGKLDCVTIFGMDYDTPDGTCIRDYVHVEDLAAAHLRALEHLAGGGSSTQLNVGTGQGHSVCEVIRCVEAVTGKTVPVVAGSRRPGDPPRLVAAADKIRSLYGWSPEYTSLEPIVRTAWQWLERGGFSN